MQTGFHVRKINNGKIRFKRRLWKPEGDTNHLNGMKMIFADYLPHEPNLLNLWGTIRFYNASYESGEQDLAWKEMCCLLGVKEGAVSFGGNSGSFLMEKEGDEFIAYRSRNIGWWKPLTEEAT